MAELDRYHGELPSLDSVVLPLTDATREDEDQIEDVDVQGMGTRCGFVRRYFVQWSGRSFSDRTWINKVELRRLHGDIY